MITPHQRAESIAYVLDCPPDDLSGYRANRWGYWRKDFRPKGAGNETVSSGIGSVDALVSARQPVSAGVISPNRRDHCNPLSIGRWDSKRKKI